VLAVQQAQTFDGSTVAATRSESAETCQGVAGYLIPSNFLRPCWHCLVDVAENAAMKSLFSHLKFELCNYMHEWQGRDWATAHHKVVAVLGPRSSCGVHEMPVWAVGRKHVQGSQWDFWVRVAAGTASRGFSSEHP